MNKWSLRRIANHLKKLGHVVSHKTVSNVINKKGKKRQARENGIIYKPSVRSRKVTKSMLVKLDRWTSNPNPLSQKEMAKRLGISQPLVSTIIKRDLKKITRKKLRVHYLSQDNKKNRKTNSRKLYERMSSKKMEFFVTVDEAHRIRNSISFTSSTTSKPMVFLAGLSTLSTFSSVALTLPTSLS